MPGASRTVWPVFGLPTGAAIKQAALDKYHMEGGAMWPPAVSDENLHRLSKSIDLLSINLRWLETVLWKPLSDTMFFQSGAGNR